MGEASTHSDPQFRLALLILIGFKRRQNVFSSYIKKDHANEM